MSKSEEGKNKILSYKYGSHSFNLLQLEPGTAEFRKERQKAERAKFRFFSFVNKVIATKKKLADSDTSGRS